MPRQTLGPSNILQAQLTNSPSRVQLILEKGKSYSFGLYFETADEHRVDLTGCSIWFTAKNPPHKGGAQILSIPGVMIDASWGHAQINLQAEDTDQRTLEYPFDVTLLTAEGYSSIVLKGLMQIVPNTSPFGPGDIYDDVQPPGSITLTITESNLVKVVVNHLTGNQLAIGSVTTLPPGEQAGARIEGDYPYQLLHLALPSGNGPKGDPGPPGPQGPPGTGGGTVDPSMLSSVWVQGTPAAVWNVVHPLTFRPVVTVVDSAGSEVEGDVTYVDATHITLSFSAAFSGTAYLS